MKSITKEEFESFIKKRKEIDELILAKTAELSMITYNRLPKGDCFEHDFIEENGKICIQFVYSHCSDSDYDTFYLPIEFLFDETYPEKYKLMYEEEQKKSEEEKLRKKLEKEELNKKKCEIFERKEYERLKAKFEKDDCKLNIEVDKIWSDDDGTL